MYVYNASLLVLFCNRLCIMRKNPFYYSTSKHDVTDTRILLIHAPTMNAI